MKLTQYLLLYSLSRWELMRTWSITIAVVVACIIVAVLLAFALQGVAADIFDQGQ